MAYMASVTRMIELPRTVVFDILADFGNIGERSPAAIESATTSGTGVGMLRHIIVRGMAEPVVERLEFLRRPELISYSIVNDSPLPVDRYHSIIELAERSPASCEVVWSSHWIARGRSEAEVRALIETMYRSSLDGLVDYARRGAQEP